MSGDGIDKLYEDCVTCDHCHIINRMEELTGWDIENCSWAFYNDDGKVHAVYTWPEWTKKHEQDYAVEFYEAADNDPRITDDPSCILGEMQVDHRGNKYQEVSLFDMCRWLYKKGLLPNKPIWIY